MAMTMDQLSAFRPVRIRPSTSVNGWHKKGVEQFSHICGEKTAEHGTTRSLVKHGSGWVKSPHPGATLVTGIAGIHRSPWIFPLRFPFLVKLGQNRLDKSWKIELRCTLSWTNILLWKITIFNGKIHYKWPFSIAMLVHQRVTYLFLY